MVPFLRVFYGDYGGEADEAGGWGVLVFEGRLCYAGVLPKGRLRLGESVYPRLLWRQDSLRLGKGVKHVVRGYVDGSKLNTELSRGKVE